MLVRTSFAATLIGLIASTNGFAQEYYSPSRTQSNNFTTVAFGNGNAGAQDDRDVVEVDIEVDDSSQQQTIEELREQVERMSLRLRELEVDVAQRAKTAKSSKAAGVSSAKSADVDSRLKDLEKGFAAQGKSIDKIDSTIPGLVHAGHKSPKAVIFGRIHLDYFAFPEAEDTIDQLEGGNPQDRVEFRRLRLGIKGDLNDNMFYKYEGEFAGGVASSYRDAYIGFKNLPFLNTVIIGNHKRPYGLDHLNSSRYNVFEERPFIVEAFNQDARRLGISSNGVSEDQSWNWRYGLWNQQLTQNQAGWRSDHYNSEVAGRLARTAWYDESSGGRGYLHYAVSGSFGIPDDTPGSTINGARYRTRPEARTTNRFLDTGFIAGADANSLFGLETVMNVGALQVTAEYMRVNVERSAATAPTDVNFDGGYVQAAYFLTGEHTPWDRKTGTLGRVKPYENFFAIRDVDGDVNRGLGAWQIAARYSYADLSDENIQGGEGESLTLGMNWWWNPNARMQFNYIFGEIENVPEGNGNYEIAGVRWMVDF